VITLREVYVLDKNSEYLGVPQSELMENAGKGIANTVSNEFDLKGKNVLVLCGRGNNGGDGFVAARYLKEHCEVKILLAMPGEEIKSDLALENLENAESSNVQVLHQSANLDRELKNADIIIDAMLGVGLKDDVKDPFRSIINKLNKLNKLNKSIVSVDVPSGFGADISIKPALTVTFHDVKEGMNSRNCGKIMVVDIGIPKDAELFTGPGEFAYYPLPHEDSHKGDNGRILVIGGGPFTGAPALAGLAAYRTGVDLVRIAVPENCYQVIASFSPNFIVHPLDGSNLKSSHLKALVKYADNVECVLIGPGAGAESETLRTISKFIKTCAKPLVIDADAIKSVGKNSGVLSGKTGIITPHRREFELLVGRDTPTDEQERAKNVSDLARRTGLTVILKGRTDVISDGARTKLNKTGNVAMSVGGTGDVLAGICAALLAKGMEPFDAARLAAFMNGASGDLSFQRKGLGLVASDVVEDIPNVLKKFLG
jgi:NAD(P)H-hydrate epimerase